MILLKRLMHYIEIHKSKQAITPFDIIIFLRQFSTMLAAGIPILRCIHTLIPCQQKIALRQMLQTIHQHLLAGKTLYNSLQPYKMHFNTLTCQFINIGEHTGKLATLLTIIANHHEAKLQFKKRVQQALFYPCLITIIAMLVCCLMFLFIIPQFATLFASTNIKLPIITEYLFQFATFFHRYFIYLLCAFILLLLFLYHSPYKTYLITALKKQISYLPIIKPHIQNLILANFTRHLAITLTAGLPLIQSLSLAQDNHLAPAFNQTLQCLAQQIRTGLQLHTAMQTTKAFPPWMIQMIHIGEESGALETMLSKLADFFDAEINNFMQTLQQLLEPLIMLILGVVIGGVVIGLYLPIFKLGSAF